VNIGMEEVYLFAIGAFISLFTIINPFSTASVFHTITKKNRVGKNKVIAKKACVTAVGIMVFFIFFGEYVLHFFSISIEAFKIASGLLVFAIGYKMINSGHRHVESDKEKAHAESKEDISIIPLAIPMMSGPGAIATGLVLMESAVEMGSVSAVASLVLSVVVIMVIAYFLLINAHALDRVMGENGVRVIDKLLGLIVLVMGVQFVINGIGGLGWFV
jgi:multiple antibiotic resistance protein